MGEPLASDRAYVVTYKPLVVSKRGREASQYFDIPPFVDGSIRREPDLVHPQPAISCLCRGKEFVPRLAVGDHVAYVTAKGCYRSREPHWRLTGVLRVAHLLDGHEVAADWYRARALPLPNNCMVSGNPAMPLERSHGKTIYRGTGTDEQVHRKWDAGYRSRASRYRRVAVSDVVYCDLSWNAPVVTEDHWQRSFGGVPGTQNPGARPFWQLQALIQVLGIAAPPSCL
jgi:hypothetical protein